MRVDRSAFYLTLFFVSLGGWGLFSCQQPNDGTNDGKSFRMQVESVPAVCMASIRGLHLVNDSVGWASGSKGTFLRMIDGKTWKADTVAKHAHLDFRDVHAFDANTALLMVAGQDGRILRTEDGGVSWVEVYTRLDSGIFLDGMDFFKGVGYCYGDPMNGKFVVIRSNDLGKTWLDITSDEMPLAMPKEAGFAASGTGVLAFENSVLIATGGDSISRVLSFNNGIWNAMNTTLRSDEGCGIFSLVRTNDRLVAVGGCYLDSTSAKANCAISMDEGATWSLIEENQPRGYRSCVSYSSTAKLLVATGSTGMEYSLNGGWDWIPVSEEGYHTCSLADSTGWVMGRGGKMAKLSWSAQ